MLTVASIGVAMFLAGTITGYIIARIERRTKCKHYTI